MGSFVVRSGDGLEAFLASSVPNLELDLLTININGLNFEVNTNGGHEVISELIVGETHE